MTMGTLVQHNEIGRLQAVPKEGGLHRVQINGAFIEDVIMRNWGGQDQLVEITISVDLVQRRTESATSSGFESKP
jgi:hypothetical protein